jgi:hypothetical protein
LGFASSISAATPEISGAAKDVPWPASPQLSVTPFPTGFATAMFPPSPPGALMKTGAPLDE